MFEYPKTENVFTRNPDTHKLNLGDLRDPSHAQIAVWHTTEKVDGTNIRVLLSRDPDGNIVPQVRGRSDRANVPGDLITNVNNTLMANMGGRFEDWFTQLTGGEENVIVCLYGEGYGAGIQKGGGLYRKDKFVRIFDVTTTPVESYASGIACGPTWWRPWDAVEEASIVTGIPHVPTYGKLTMDEIIALATKPFTSITSALDSGGDLQSEGLICRTDPYLYDWRGKRVMFKIKTHDFEQEAV